MYTIKIIGIILVTLLAIPTVAIGGSVTVSLIQGKSPSEAVQILAVQMDNLIGKTAEIEEKQIELEQTLDDTTLIVDEVKKENEDLRTKLSEEKIRNDLQEAQREKDKYCEELAQVTSQFLPVKNPIDETYKSLFTQNSVTFEQAYEEHKDNGAKVLLESDFRVEWQKGKDSRDQKLAEMKPSYDEYVSNCR